MEVRGIRLLTAVVLLAAGCAAQPGPAEAPPQIPNPHYVTVNESILVDAPVTRFGHGSVGSATLRSG
jgi:hypothetical protein